MADTTAEKPPTAAHATAERQAEIADPGPLGLAAFALTTFVLSSLNAGLLKAGTESIVIGLALFYGGLAQLAAGMWEFKKNNTFGAVAFTSYGAFWLSFAGIHFFYKPVGVSASQSGDTVGVFLLGWAIFTVYMMIGSLKVSRAVAAVFVFLTATFLLLALGALMSKEGITHAGGYLGLVTAVLAWYASSAAVINSTWKRTVLPTGPVA